MDNMNSFIDVLNNIHKVQGYDFQKKLGVMSKSVVLVQLKNYVDRQTFAELKDQSTIFDMVNLLNKNSTVMKEQRSLNELEVFRAKIIQLFNAIRL